MPQKFENREWISRNNNKWYELYGYHEIIGEISSSRMRWLCHIQRSARNYTFYKIHNGNPNEKYVQEIQERGGWRVHNIEKTRFQVRQGLVLQGLVF